MKLDFDFKDKKLIFVSGKGGTGKTSFSVLLAEKASIQGRKVLLVEQSNEPLLPHFIDGKSSSVDVLNLGLENAFKEFVCEYMGQPFLYEKIFNNQSIRTFLRTIPGLPETMVLGKLYYTLEVENPQKYDLVIFDSPASGHFYNLILTPQTIISSGLGGPFIKEVEKIDSFLRKPSTSIVLLTLPEPLVASETAEYVKKIHGLEGFKVGCLIRNKWFKTDEQNLLDLKRFPHLHRFFDKDMMKQKAAERLLSDALSGEEVIQVTVGYEDDIANKSIVSASNRSDTSNTGELNP